MDGHPAWGRRWGGVRARGLFTRFAGRFLLGAELPPRYVRPPTIDDVEAPGGEAEDAPTAATRVARWGTEDGLGGSGAGCEVPAWISDSHVAPDSPADWSWGTVSSENSTDG